MIRSRSRGAVNHLDPGGKVVNLARDQMGPAAILFLRSIVGCIPGSLRGTVCGNAMNDGAASFSSRYKYAEGDERRMIWISRLPSHLHYLHYPHRRMPNTVRVSGHLGFGQGEGRDHNGFGLFSLGARVRNSARVCEAIHNGGSHPESPFHIP